MRASTIPLDTKLRAKAIALETFAERVSYEAHDKPLKKYGALALSPGGDPRKDVFDYLLNELAGLPRYASMIHHRAVQLDGPSALGSRVDVGKVRELIDAFVANVGPELEAIRQHYLVHDADLGDAEPRA